jgi:hypothetical protein
VVPGDRGLGTLADDPREGCRHAAEVVRVLLRETPVVRACVEVAAFSRGPALTVGRESQDSGDLAGCADDVASSADQLAGTAGQHGDAVVITDEPGQDNRGGVGPVLPVATKAPLVGDCDLSLNVGAAWRD